MFKSLAFRCFRRSTSATNLFPGVIVLALSDLLSQLVVQFFRFFDWYSGAEFGLQGHHEIVELAIILLAVGTFVVSLLAAFEIFLTKTRDPNRCTFLCGLAG